MKIVIDITENGDYVIADDRGFVRMVERLCVKFLTAAYRAGFKRLAGVKKG